MPIRTAILGYGRSGSTMHAGAIESNEPFAMVAACDLDPARREQASERFGCATYEDHRDMLAKEELDLVSVITRSDQHCQMTCDCLAAGVNVLVTKPWAVSAAEAERMVAAASASGKRLFPWLPARWGGVLRRLQRIIEDKTIGNVFLVRRVVASFGTRCDWQTERRYGGGYLLNWGPHIVDPPVVLMNSRVTSVYGRMKQVINPGDVEDVFYAAMNLECGTIVQAEYTLSVDSPPDWVLQGDRGTVVVRGANVKTYRNTPTMPGDPTRYSAMKSSHEDVTEETVPGPPYGDQNTVYAEVAEALSANTAFAVLPEDALQLSRVLDAIRTASEQNRVVTL